MAKIDEFHFAKDSEVDPNFFVPAGVSPLHVGERNTISNGPDDGTLNKMATVLWQPLRHSSTTQLADNLSTNTTERICNVGGHGNVGFFETGAGQQLSYRDDIYVFGWNKFAWLPQFQRLQNKNYLQMSIWACDTGQGQDGADLLFSLAQLIGFAVSASSGQVVTNGQSMWLEPGAQWVTATPTVRPTPVGPPQHAAYIAEGKPMVPIRKGVELVRVPLEDISSISIERIEFGVSKPIETIAGAGAQALAWRLFHTKPFKLPGAPMAFLTARLEVNMAPSKGKKDVRRLLVFNDRLVYDTMSHEAYFARPRLFG